MATAAPFLSPTLLALSIPHLSTALFATGAATALTASSSGTLSTLASTATPAVVKAASAKLGATSIILYRVLRGYVKNTRITPVATYLAYKSSGFADTGPVSGMTISDFVSVWTPYNTGGPGPTRKGKEARALAKAARGLSGETAGVLDRGIKVLGGTRESTGLVVLETEGRESRPARQTVSFGERKRHFCRQLGCEKDAV